MVGSMAYIVSFFIGVAPGVCIGNLPVAICALAQVVRPHASLLGAKDCLAANSMLSILGFPRTRLSPQSRQQWRVQELQVHVQAG